MIEHPKKLNHRVRLSHKSLIVLDLLHKMNNRVYKTCYKKYNNYIVKYRPHIGYKPVSYTHLTLPTICSV